MTNLGEALDHNMVDEGGGRHGRLDVTAQWRDITLPERQVGVTKFSSNHASCQEKASAGADYHVVLSVGLPGLFPHPL